MFQERGKLWYDNLLQLPDRAFQSPDRIDDLGGAPVETFREFLDEFQETFDRVHWRLDR